MQKPSSSARRLQIVKPILAAILLVLLVWAILSRGHTVDATEPPSTTTTSPMAAAPARLLPPAAGRLQVDNSPVITVTKKDDFPGAGAEPGETITYTIVVTNESITDALGVTLSDTIDLHTTIVDGSLRASPMAAADAYDAVGNTRIAITPTNGLLANDVDPDDPDPNPAFNDGLTVVAFDAASVNGGDVTVAADGSFTYDPPAGFEGVDTFTYTVEDGHGLTDAGTVTVTVSDVIWYVDHTATSGGDGRSHSPFDSVAAFNSSSLDETSDVIFLYEQGGGPYDNGITLLDDQQLIGQGVDLVTTAGLTPPLGATFPPVTSNPTLDNATADNGSNGVVLAQNNALHGLNVGDTGGAGITGANFGTLTVSAASVIGGGAILDLNAGTLDAAFDALSTTSSATAGVSLTDVDGDLTAADGSIAGTAGDAFDVNGGTVAVTYPGSITQSAAARIVQVQNRPAGAGAVRFSGNLTCNTSCTGINVAGNSGGTVNFSGGSKVLNTGGNPAVTLSNNTGAAILFTNGGLDIDTTSGAGFRATGGGNVNVTTGTNPNTVHTTAGIGVNIANTTIGGSGVTFESVSVDGATNGIILNATGASGGFTITGDAGSTVNGSGGTLTNITGDAIQLTDTMSFAMDQLNMSSVSNHGIVGIRVDGLSIRNATFTGMGDADGEDVFSFDRDTQGDNGLVGTAVFQNLTITNFAERAIDIVNEGSGTLDLDILDVSADDNDDTFGEDAIRVQTEGSVNADVLVSGGVYDNIELDVLAYFAQGSGTNTVEVTGVTSTNGGGPDNNPNGGGVAIIGSAGSTTSFDIHANSLTGVQGAVVQIIGLAGAGQTVTLNGTIGGPTLSDANTLTSDNADGIDLDFDGDPGGGSAIGGTILVQNNTIDFDDDGIGIDHRDAAGTMNVTIRDNTLNGIAGDDASTTDIDDGIFIFTDDDAGAAVNQLNVEVIDNEINNVASTKNVIEIVDVQNGNKVCFAAVGTTISSGDGNIELDTDAAADLVVDADSAADLSALNNSIPVVEVVTPTYDSTVDCISQTSSNSAGTFTTVDIDGASGSGIAIANNSSAVNVNGSSIGNSPPAASHRPAPAARPVALAKPLAAPAALPALATPGDTATLLADPFTLPGGETFTVTFAVTIADPLPAGVDSVQNQAAVMGSNFDDVLSVDPDPHAGFPPVNGETVTPINAAPDLSLAKDDGGISAAAHETVTYTLTYSNTGTQHASSVVITETVPAHTTFNPGASSAGWSCAPDGSAGSACTLAVGNVDAGDPPATVAFAVDVAGSVPAGTTQISNTADIGDDGSGGDDPTPADNTATDTTPLITADLVVSKSDNPDPAVAGEMLTYTVTITNNGPSAAQNVVATDTLTDVLALVNTAGCAEDPGGAPTCSLGAVGVGESVSYTLLALVDSSTLADTITNTVSVASAALEAAPGDESATVTTTVNAVADLELAKRDTPDPLLAGEPLTFTLVLTNHGPSLAQGVFVTDTLPVTDYTYTGNDCGATFSSPTLDWTIGDAPAGSVFTCVITGAVNAGVSGAITNTAGVGLAASIADPDLSNNSVEEPTAVFDNLFTIGDVAQSEGDGGATAFTFTVSRTSTASAGAVDYATAGDTAAAGQDYTATSGTVNFAAGGSLTQTVIVDVHGDGVVELDETFFVNLSNPAGGGIGDGQGLGTIMNDDSATLSIGDVSQNEGDSGMSSFVFSVTLSAAVDTAVALDYATADDTATTADGDYTPVSGALSFSGAAGETQTVAVDVHGDAAVEPDETFHVDLSNVSAAGRDVALADGRGTGTILNDDGITALAYLPVVRAPAPVYPDLVVGVLAVSNDDVQVVIHNQGAAPVTQPFWVDLYLDPSPPPTAVNETWTTVAAFGAVWGVGGDALPLRPGEALTLTLHDAYYEPTLSHLPDTIAAGAAVYAQVDSADADTDYGAVLESHEAAGDPYNNIAGPVAAPPPSQ